MIFFVIQRMLLCKLHRNCNKESNFEEHTYLYRIFAHKIVKNSNIFRKYNFTDIFDKPCWWEPPPATIAFFCFIIFILFASSWLYVEWRSRLNTPALRDIDSFSWIKDNLETLYKSENRKKLEELYLVILLES